MPAPFADYVGLALRSGRALLDLINDLLDQAWLAATAEPAPPADDDARRKPAAADAAADAAPWPEATAAYTDVQNTGAGQWR